MNKDNKNRRKAAIGAVIAAGMAAGGLAVYGNGTNASSEMALTAADVVMIDGQAVTVSDLALADNNRRGNKPKVKKNVYGPRVKMYGPRPNPPKPKQKMDSAQVSHQVINIVARHMKLDVDMVTTASRFVEDLGADSLDLVEIVMAVEKEFKITVPEEQLYQLDTVEKLVNCVREEKKKTDKNRL